MDLPLDWAAETRSSEKAVSALAVVDKKSGTAEHGHGFDHCCGATVKIHHDEPGLGGCHGGADGRLCVVGGRRCRAQIWQTGRRPGRSSVTRTLTPWWRCRWCRVIGSRRTAVSQCRLMNGTSAAVSTAFLLLLLERVATILCARVLKPDLSLEIQLKTRKGMKSQQNERNRLRWNLG